MGKIKNLINQKFGRLTVIEFAGFGSSHKTQWKCKCDCGKEVIVKSNSLITGHTKSCGCLETEVKREINKTHGLRYDPLYRTWLNMRDRCNNPNNSHYIYYGKKGVKVCNLWNNFKEFHTWAYSNGYIPNSNLSIERVDNSKGYCPENCKWIKISEQSKNKTSNYQIEYDGKLRTVAEISEITGIKAPTLYSRIRRTGSIYLKNGSIS